MRVYKKVVDLLRDLKFAIFLLLFIAFGSSLGSLIEQDQGETFYSENYSKALYGFLTGKLILAWGLDHVYTTWWFVLSLLLLGVSLLTCTLVRQFPLVKNSKILSFKKFFSSFSLLPFFVRTPKAYQTDQNFLTISKRNSYYLYQKKNAIYAFKGLIGRISPVLVHASLLLILISSFFTAFNTFRVQEVIPKGEIFHFQNIRTIGKVTTLPSLELRINDFWIEYREKILHQFYSDISILNSFGNELTRQSISVNNPLIYQGIDIYQSDWNLIGIREKNFSVGKTIEYPLFSFDNKQQKNLITWIKKKEIIFTLIVNDFQGDYFLYNEKGVLLKGNNSQEEFGDNSLIFDIIPSSGLLIKYDPNIPFIYAGFAGLIFSTFLSYIPYNQFWVISFPRQFWMASTTNRGKTHLEIENENFFRLLS